MAVKTFKKRKDESWFDVAERKFGNRDFGRDLIRKFGQGRSGVQYRVNEQTLTGQVGTALAGQLGLNPWGLPAGEVPLGFDPSAYDPEGSFAQTFPQFFPGGATAAAPGTIDPGGELVLDPDFPTGQASFLTAQQSEIDKNRAVAERLGIDPDSEAFETLGFAQGPSGGVAAVAGAENLLAELRNLQRQERLLSRDARVGAVPPTEPTGIYDPFAELAEFMTPPPAFHEELSPLEKLQERISGIQGQIEPRPIGEPEQALDPFSPEAIRQEAATLPDGRFASPEEIAAILRQGPLSPQGAETIIMETDHPDGLNSLEVQQLAFMYKTQINLGKAPGVIADITALDMLGRDPDYRTTMGALGYVLNEETGYWEYTGLTTPTGVGVGASAGTGIASSYYGGGGGGGGGRRNSGSYIPSGSDLFTWRANFG